MNLSLFRHAFVLILVSLVGAFFVPAMAVPRLGLSAHTSGILSAVLLIGIGAIWQQFRLSPAQAAALKWSWVISSYLNWLGCLVGAIFGAGKFTPIASGGITGDDIPELVVAAMLTSVGLLSLAGTGLALWGLRPRA